MGLSTIKIQNIDTNLVPTASLLNSTVADQTLSQDASTASDFIQTALDDLTTHVFWTVDGANVRVTFDGSTPTTSVGHYIADGDSGIWRKETAEAAKVIAASGTANIHISEMTA